MELTLNTVVDIKLNGGLSRVTLGDLYSEDKYQSKESFLSVIEKWIHTGNAFVVEQKSREEEIADKIFEELQAVQRGKTIEQDRIDRENYGAESRGVYGKVGFPAKSILDGQEMIQALMKNFNIKQSQVGLEMKDGATIVTITECPIKTYGQIELAFGFKRATEAVSGAVNKTANAIVNTADMTVSNIAVPVAKTAISTSAKIAKTMFGFGAKLAGIAVGETVKATKQCVSEIKNDGYIAEAKGEVIDGVHTVKRAFGNTSFGVNGGIIME